MTGKHCYALVNPCDNSIMRTTPPLETPPPNGPPLIWQQVADDSPAHNPETHERHSPRIVMRNDGRAYREFQIRRKGVA